MKIDVHRFANNPLLAPENLRPSRPDFEVTCVLNPGAFRFGNRIGAAEERVDQIHIAFHRVSRRDIERETVSEFCRRFARMCEPRHRPPAGRRRENRASDKPLKIDDQIVTPTPELFHQMREFRNQRQRPAEPLAVEQYPVRDRERTVVENLRKSRMHKIVQFGFRALPAQQFQCRKYVEDIPQTARLDRQNPFDFALHLSEQGRVKLSCPSRGGSQDAPAGPRR